MRRRRADELSTGVFLIGLGLCFYFGFWPWILFAIGGASIAQGLVAGRGWYAFQGAAWMIGLGVWALMHFSIAGLFVMFGLSIVLGSLFRPPFLRPKSKPFVDNTLE